MDDKRARYARTEFMLGQKPIDLLLRDHIRYLNSYGRLRPDGDWL